MPMQLTQDQPIAGDSSFRGVNMRLPADELPDGFCADGRNARFTNGVAGPRPGSYITAWTNINSVGSPTPVPYGATLGSGTFLDPNSVAWILVASEDGHVYATRPNNGSIVVPLPAGVTITDEVTFEQCPPGTVVMFRGTSLAPLVMESIDEGFKAIVELANDSAVADQNPSDGTEPIPNGVFGLSMQNRVFVPYDKDFVAASDYLNYSRYQPVLEAFRVNQGDEQRITSLHEINSTTALVGKDRSIHVIENVKGDLSDMVRTRVTKEYGIVSRRCTIDVNGEPWFLASGIGVVTLSQTVNGLWKSGEGPKSYDIQPLIDRINWDVADRFRAAKVGNFSYWAVSLDNSAVTRGSSLATLLSETITVEAGKWYRWTPTDGGVTLTNGTETYTVAADFVAQGSTVVRNEIGSEDTLYELVVGALTTVLVYDHLNGAWAGYDEGSAIAVKDWIVFPYLGKERLFMLNEAGYIMLYESGASDEITPDVYEAIDFNVLTRGYSILSALGRQRAKAMTLDLAVWNPRYSVSAVLDGVNESIPIATDKTRDRTKYFVHGKAPYDTTNINDDYADEKREDYSLLVGTTNETRLYLGANGINPDYEQTTTETYRVPASARGRFVQFAISSDQGRVSLQGVRVQAIPANKKKGVHR